MSTAGDRPSTLIFLAEAPKSPPFSTTARRRIGFLFRELQDGASIGMPSSRRMPSIGPRVRDAAAYWRVVYRLDPGSVVVVHAFPKTARKTPKEVIRLCRGRLADHDARRGGGE